MPEWSLEIDGFEYQPIPQSWLDHPAAVDSDEKAGPRLLAVSAATYGSKTLRIRYAQPRTGDILHIQTGATTREGRSGVVPLGLVTGRGWSRSLKPGRCDPQDTIRSVERDHLRELWQERVRYPETGERLDDVLDERDDGRLVADGGHPMSGGERRECTDKLCSNDAEFAYRFEDGFSRVRSPERSALEDGDLCPYVCSQCRNRMAASAHWESDRFVRPEGMLNPVAERRNSPTASVEGNRNGGVKSAE